MSTCQENGHYCPNCDTSFSAESDLIRENAELTASIAGLREALICSRRHVGVLTEKLASKKIFVTYDKSEILSDAALTESPAASLAAITAPLEARIHDLSIALHTAIDRGNGGESKP